MVVRIGNDGRKMWECSVCHVFKSYNELHSKRTKHGKGKTICCMCADASSTSPHVGHAAGWILSDKLPGAKAAQRLLWREIRPLVCRFRRKVNMERYPAEMLREQAMEDIFNRAEPLPEKFRKSVLKIMAGYEIKPRAGLWWAFREGVFNEEQLRRMAFGFVEQAIEYTKLDKAYSATPTILEEVRRCMNTPGAKLTNALQNAQALQREVGKGFYRNPGVPHAAAALAGLCLPGAEDAAISTVHSVVMALKHVQMDREIILANLNSIVRDMASEALKGYAKEELVHWDGLVSVTLAGAVTVEDLER